MLGNSRPLMSATPPDPSEPLGRGIAKSTRTEMEGWRWLVYWSKDVENHLGFSEDADFFGSFGGLMMAYDGL